MIQIIISQWRETRVYRWSSNGANIIACIIVGHYRQLALTRRTGRNGTERIEARRIETEKKREKARCGTSRPVRRGVRGLWARLNLKVFAHNVALVSYVCRVFASDCCASQLNAGQQSNRRSLVGITRRRFVSINGNSDS